MRYFATKEEARNDLEDENYHEWNINGNIIRILDDKFHKYNSFPADLILFLSELGHSHLIYRFYFKDRDGGCFALDYHGYDLNKIFVNKKDGKLYSLNELNHKTFTVYFTINRNDYELIRIDLSKYDTNEINKILFTFSEMNLRIAYGYCEQFGLMNNLKDKFRRGDLDFYLDVYRIVNDPVFLDLGYKSIHETFLKYFNSKSFTNGIVLWKVLSSLDEDLRYLFHDYPEKFMTNHLY